MNGSKESIGVQASNTSTTSDDVEDSNTSIKTNKTTLAPARQNEQNMSTGTDHVFKNISNSSRVSWSSVNLIVSIETRSEIVPMKAELWYNKRNFHEFKEDAVEELKAYMRRHGIRDPDVALETIYQSDDIEMFSYSESSSSSSESSCDGNEA
jgi:hypothetical protein